MQFPHMCIRVGPQGRGGKVAAAMRNADAVQHPARKPQQFNSVDMDGVLTQISNHPISTHDLSRTAPQAVKACRLAKLQTAHKPRHMRRSRTTSVRLEPDGDMTRRAETRLSNRKFIRPSRNSSGVSCELRGI